MTRVHDEQHSPHRQSIRRTLVLSLTIAAVAILLFIEWRMVRGAPPGEVAEQDTMCLVSRIGLPCRP